jgi:hypothetical protein
MNLKKIFTKKDRAKALVKTDVSKSVTDKDFRIGNLINYRIVDKMDERQEWLEVSEIDYDDLRIIGAKHEMNQDYQIIELTENWLERLGFSVISESSAGKRYGYVIDGIFSSDLTFTFWKTTKEAGKFFRGDLELKSVHQIQNLYFALTGRELTVC